MQHEVINNTLSFHFLGEEDLTVAGKLSKLLTEGTMSFDSQLLAGWVVAPSSHPEDVHEQSLGFFSPGRAGANHKPRTATTRLMPIGGDPCHIGAWQISLNCGRPIGWNTKPSR